jgi:hypothetical protein
MTKPRPKRNLGQGLSALNGSLVYIVALYVFLAGLTLRGGKPQANEWNLKPKVLEILAAAAALKSPRYPYCYVFGGAS